MYLAHFKLNEKPFLLNTDPRFLWLGPSHQEALATLCYGVRENNGLLLLTGDIGTGKTTLISALMDRLKGDTVSVARVLDPGRDRNEFFFLVARSFGIKMLVNDKQSFTKIISSFLEGLRKKGEKALLILDEAQIMSNEILEEVRLLSNLESHNTNLLSIFLLGSNELNQLLLEQQNRAIRERISITYNLLPLSEDETGAYIAHRLRVAGAKTLIFNTDAVGKIYAYSKGSVRLINILCDLALVFGFEEDATQIDGSIIESCKKHLCISPKPVPPIPVPHSPAPPNTLDLVKITSTYAETGPHEYKALRPPVKHATRTGRIILFTLLFFLPVSYLLSANFNHAPLPAKPTVNNKIPLPAGRLPHKKTGLTDPSQQPLSGMVKTHVIGKDSMTSPGESGSPAVDTLGRSVSVQEKALSEDPGSGSADRTAKIVNDNEPGSTQGMSRPMEISSTTVRSETEYSQTSENALDDPLPDMNNPIQSDVSTRQAAKSRRLSSEPPDPAAIIDWLLFENPKPSGAQSQ